VNRRRLRKSGERVPRSYEAVGVGDGGGTGLSRGEGDGESDGAVGAGTGMAGQVNHFAKSSASFPTKVKECPPIGEWDVTGIFKAINFLLHRSISP